MLKSLLQLYLQTLGYARKACVDKHSSLLLKSITYGQKNCYIIGSEHNNTNFLAFQDIYLSGANPLASG